MLLWTDSVLRANASDRRFKAVPRVTRPTGVNHLISAVLTRWDVFIQLLIPMVKQPLLDVHKVIVNLQTPRHAGALAVAGRHVNARRQRD